MLTNAQHERWPLARYEQDRSPRHWQRCITVSQQVHAIISISLEDQEEGRTFCSKSIKRTGTAYTSATTILFNKLLFGSIVAFQRKSYLLFVCVFSGQQLPREERERINVKRCKALYRMGDEQFMIVSAVGWCRENSISYPIYEGSFHKAMHLLFRYLIGLTCLL